MRVLTVIDSLAIGGAEQSLVAMTPHLATRGVEMHVGYLSERDGVREALEAGGAGVWSLAGTGGRPAAIARTRRLIEELQPDLVHTTLFEADLTGRVAGRTKGVPVVSSLVTEAYGPEHLDNPDFSRWKVRAAQAVDIATARLVRRFHAVSLSTAQVMAQRLFLAKSSIDVIHRGRDEARLGRRTDERRRAAREILELPPSAPLVLAVGRHYHFKGLDLLVRAFPQVVAQRPGAQLFIAGREGPATPQLKRLIAAHRLEDRVRLLGYRNDIADLMCAADAFVLPSRAEGSPGVLIEAMALEVPVASADIPAAREVAGDTDATVEWFTLGDDPGTAAAIEHLLGRPDHAAALAARARMRFERHYTMQAIADETVEFYRRALAS